MYKIVTICGSMKFKNDMLILAEELAIKGYCVLTPVFEIKERSITKDQLQKMREAHFKRIELSDSILVMNVDGYIGESIKLEIQYAKSLNKKVLYYTDLLKEKKN